MSGSHPSPTTPGYWEIFSAYEKGKSRRYGHLFAVNGGAFAIVGFLSERHTGQDPASMLFDAWAFFLIPALLSVFAWYMCEDIDSFGRGMRTLAGYPEDEDLDRGIYRRDGRRLLGLVQAIFTGGWAIAAVIGLIDSVRSLMA